MTEEALGLTQGCTTRSPGKVLVINLSDRSSRCYPLPERDLLRFLGGSALATALLLRYSEPGADPLSPANPLVIAPGLLSGSGAPGSDRLALAAKSPLTGRIGESMLSGRIAASLRLAGYAAVVVTGRADHPTTLA